jgi:NAD dependent epimerase/dehydratase family enzyme
MQAARQLRIVIPGGTGVLGSLLARHFHEAGHALATITRFPKPGPGESIHWDAETIGPWVSSLEGADVVINLTASADPVARIRTTQLVAAAIGECERAPRVWMNAGFSEPEAAWEECVTSTWTPQTRKIILRLAPVMSPDFGSFPGYLRLVRWGLGGEIGSGEQFVDWIHESDFLRAVEFLAGREEIEGSVHVTSPCALPNHEFMAILRDAWCTSYFGLPIPGWLAPARVLRSRNVVPASLLAAGFAFHFPGWRGAAEELVRRWRHGNEG